MSQSDIEPSTSQTVAKRSRHAVGLPISWYFDPEILEIERQQLFAAGPTYAGHPVARAAATATTWPSADSKSGRLLVRNNGRAAARFERLPASPGADAAPAAATPRTSSARSTIGPTTSTAGRSPRPTSARIRASTWSGPSSPSGTACCSPARATSAASWRRSTSWTELAASDYVLERVDEEEHDLNWKVFLEVYLEDYHIGAVHPGFRAFVDPTDLRGAFQAVGGERFFCEQVNVRWPLPPAATPMFAEYQKVLMDVLAGRRPPFAAIWMCLFSGPARRVVPVHDGRDDLHAALADAHAAAERVLLRPRDRRNAPRLRRNRPGRARRSHRRRPRRGRKRCRTAGRRSTTAATTPRARIRCRWSRACGGSTIACGRSCRTHRTLDAARCQRRRNSARGVRSRLR